MKNSETCERYEIEYQNADYYGEYKYACAVFCRFQLKNLWSLIWQKPSVNPLKR